MNIARSLLSFAILCCCIPVISAFHPAAPEETVPVASPSEYLGIEVGADGTLADWSQVEKYYRHIAENSKRVQLQEIGKSVGGRTIIAALITSAENHSNMTNLLEVQRDITYSMATEEEEDRWRDHKPCILLNYSMHSTEVGPIQYSMQLIHRLAASDEPEIAELLDKTVLIILPTINPDGVDMVVDFYRQYKGTDMEGSTPPWLYHAYAGHDNNRDWYMLNLKETRQVNRFISQVWFPQVVWDNHQMGSRGYRAIIPPHVGPPNPFIHPLIISSIEAVGSSMQASALRAGHAGVAHSSIFSLWWNGGFRTAPYYRNSIGLLTELASASLAKPVEVSEEELIGGRRNYTVPSINNPMPWKGGRWGLPEIVSYHHSLTDGFFEYLRDNAESIVMDYRRMCLDARQANDDGPAGYVILPGQHDQSATDHLLWILGEHGIAVSQLDKVFELDGKMLPAGTAVISGRQPFRPMIRSLLERVMYPTGGDASDNPYDVSASTLSDLMGVDVQSISRQAWDSLGVEDRLVAYVADKRYYPSTSSGTTYYFAGDTGSYAEVNKVIAAGGMVAREIIQAPDGATGQSFVHYDPGRDARGMDITADIEAFKQQAFSLPRLGLLRGYYNSMDEGWTRYLLESYHFPFESLDEAEIIAGNLNSSYDAIILPSIRAEQLIEGRRNNEGYPDDLRGGIGEEGVAALKEFVVNGGMLICLDNACAFALEHLDLPVTNLIADVERDEFNIPGSIVALEVDISHPLSWGMAEHPAAMFRRSFAFEIDEAAEGVTVAARYAHEDVLLSGFARGEESISGKAAVLEARSGEGTVILIGFPAQFRAQSYATFKFLFNAIHLSGNGYAPLG